MNKVFKVIWSKAKNCYVVASELAKSHTKSPKSGVMSRALVAGVLACMLSCGAVLPVYAQDMTVSNQTMNVTGDLVGTPNSYTDNISYNCLMCSDLICSDATWTLPFAPINWVLSDDVSNFAAIKAAFDSTFGIVDSNGNFTQMNSNLTESILTQGGTVLPATNPSAQFYPNAYRDPLTGVIYQFPRNQPLWFNLTHGTDSNGNGFVYIESFRNSQDLALNSFSAGGTLLSEREILGSGGAIDKLTVNSSTLTATGDINVGSISSSSSSISAKSIKTTSGGIDATTSDVTATESVESAGPVKVKSLNAPMLTAGSGASSIGGALTVAGKISGVTAGTANTDAVNYSQLKPAIKALSVSGKTITYTKIDGTTGTITTQDTDTHYTTHLYAGSGTAANANTTNGNTKLTLADNSTVRESITIKGTGATTVTSSGGVITINSTDNNTTYSAMTGATASAAGTAGLVPAPAAGKQTAFLRGDGTWVVPTDTNTHYTTHLYAGTGAAANAATSNGSTKIALTDDSTVRNTLTIKGTGATTVTSDANGVITINSTDNNTTYSAATQSANGLMTAADKKKLDGIASGANAYTLPAATSSALGGVKIGSNITNSDGTISLTKANVTAALGYTPPTTDTNTTYDNMSATELSTGTATTARSISAKTIADYVTGKVSAETTARTSAVSSEATTRANADTALGTRIDGTIKDLSVSGRTITYTRGDGTTGTITTQDSNTTYDAMSASELSTGTATTARTVTAKVLGDYVTGKVSAETTARTTAINSEATTRANADTALGTRIDNVITAYESADTGLSNRIGSLSADGNYIKKSATNNVSANLTALDTQLKTTATAVGTETTNRTNADTALSNRIGSLTADGNYIKKAGTKNVSENLSLLDVQLKTTTDGLATEVTNRTNAVSSEATARTNADTALGTRIDNVTSAYQSADTGLSNRIGSVASDGTFIKKSATNDVAANLTALDTAAKNAIKGLSVSGTTITYTKGDGTTGTITTQDNNTTYDSMTASELSTGTATTARSISAKVLGDYVTGKVSAETTARTTAINSEASTRQSEDTALSNRIGSLSADGNYIKKSATNNVSANLSALDTQLKTTTTSISTETTNRTNADTALSNRIGSLSADGNYIKKAGTKNVSENLSLLDAQLKTTTDGLASEVTNRTNAVSGEATTRANADTALGTRIDNVTSAYQTADTGLSNRIGTLTADGNYIKKSSTNDLATNLQILDTKIKSMDSSMSSDLSTITTDYTTADTALSNRIGSLASDGNYIKKSSTNDVIANLSALDTQLKATDTAALKYDGSNHELATLGGTNGTKLTNLKQGTLSASSKDAVTGAQLYATNQSIAGFATDITRNKNNIRDLNDSVSSALDAVSSASTLVDTINGLKADASLNNLTAAGRQVIATAAANAVQEYIASNASLNMSMSPLSAGRGLSSSGTLNVTDAGNGSLHVGEGSYVNGTSSIAIGVGNQVNANNSGAFGDPSIINADESYVLGNDDTINEGATGSFLIGNDSVSDAKGGLSLGSNNKLESSAEDSVLLGNNTSASGRNSVALGSGSVAENDDVISVGNNTLKRRIMNVADGDVSEGSSDVVTGGQLYVTNEKVKTNEEAIAKKADMDASNIDVDKWSEKLATGTVAEGNTGLVNGGTVYEAMNGVAGAIMNASIVKTDGENIFVGAEMGGRAISVMNNEGESRVITGVATNPQDSSSAANVGYVNAVGELIASNISQSVGKVNNRIDKVGANAAALASLTPASFEGSEKWSIAASVGHFKGETAGAVGAFYKPAENVMMNVRGSFGNDESMLGAGVAIALDKGDVKGVTKRQLADAVNKQAKVIDTMKQEREEDRARIVQLEAAVQALLKEKNSDSSK